MSLAQWVSNTFIFGSAELYPSSLSSPTDSAYSLFFLSGTSTRRVNPPYGVQHPRQF